MRTIAALAATLSLALLPACASLDAQVATVNPQLTKACALEAAAYGALTLFTGASAAIAQAHAVAAAICDDPPADTAAAVDAVLDAYAALQAARANLEG